MFSEYRLALKLFPRSGDWYTAPPEKPPLPFPCRALEIAGAPYTMYYLVDEEAEVVVLHFEPQAARR